MNAIILAAGIGTRLRPITLETPKSLIEVNGIPLIERQIEFLKEKGIQDINVVTGYLAHKFDYLKEKYNVNLVHNEKYNEYNNIYTMYLVKDLLSDTYVIDADNYIHENFLKENPGKSMYFSTFKSGFDNEEWVLNYDEEMNKLTSILVVKDEEREGYVMAGISFWHQNDCEVIKTKLIDAIENRDFSDMYWDAMISENLEQLDVYVEPLGTNLVFEIDTVKDLNELKEILKTMAV